MENFNTKCNSQEGINMHGGSVIDTVNGITMPKESRDVYERRRTAFFEKEKAQFMGSKIELDDQEQLLNEHLMKIKSDEIATVRANDSPYPPATHFFKSKALYEESKVFQIIKKMPKGGMLHIHDQSAVDLKWVIKEATYDPNCYLRSSGEGQVQFKFSRTLPPQEKGQGEWKQVIAERNQSKNPQEFDQKLYNYLSLIVPDPDEKYTSQDVVWKYFIQAFINIAGIFSYKPLFEKYYSETLRQIYDDNVQYLELRCVFLEIYDLDGKIYDRDWIMETYENLTAKFKKSHPKFIGAKIILTNLRNLDKTVISTDVKDAIRYHQKFPEMFAGYDLVGQEDPGHSLHYFLDDLLYPEQTGQKIKYVFHAGETTWQGEDVDENLIDAILLNTSRIGHGFAVTKHPEVQAAVKKNEIAIEVNPISNQVLKLVSDLRDHPMAALIAQDYPIVISSDDPGIWGALPLSHDFYAAFMALGGAKADLRMLKQCALNSIKYSSMDDGEKNQAMKIWQASWDDFVKTTLRDLEMSTFNNIDKQQQREHTATRL